MTRARRGRAIHEGLVGERALVGQPYLRDPDLRQEYAEDIAPRTEVALAKVLREVFGSAGGRASRVLDLGAGTGAVGAAVRAFFGPATEVIAVDRVAGPGIVVADLVAPGPVPGVTGRFDLIVAAHLLNELFVAHASARRIEARAERVSAWCETLLTPGGTLVILEPALRETSRDLLAVRDRLIGAGLRIVAPCLWSGPCPALARERDWCHDVTYEPAAVIGQRPRRVDFAYLALRTIGEPSQDPSLFRVVSDRLEEKGRLRLYGCGPAGRHPLVRLDRHHTESNAAFADAERGDLIRVSDTTIAGDGLRVGPDSAVEIRSPLPSATSAGEG
jgi:SAM-dependent methyltransferase